MIPSAGLFLPETLHRREHPDSNHMESDITKLRYFQRKSGQPKLEAREAGMSLPSGLDEPPADTNIFSSIATAFHFADFVFTSSKASSESHVLACLIDRVRKDVSEASRLYLSPRIFSFLEAWPDKKSRIDTILIDVRQSLNDIGRYMETFRVAGDDGGAAGLKRKFEWIANHQKRLMNKQQLLSTCHQSLMTAINIMQTVELCGVTNGLWQDPIYEAPVQPWVKRESSHILRGPYSRREYRISQKNLSLSSMYLPQPDEDDVETRSINSIPAELPGSTPDEVANSNEAEVSRFPSYRDAYKRTSFRRSYFARPFDNPTTYAPTETSSITSSLISELDNLQIQPLAENTLTQDSSDQSLSIPSASHNTRKFLDTPRPYSHSEQSQSHARSDTRSHIFSELTGTLPTVAEKTVERNDSTTSTIAVVTDTQVAKRYHVNPVYIRRNAGRHRSMPSVLPHVQSQSSLTEDLAAWMTTVQSEKLESAEWDTSSVLSSPSTSVASYPAVPSVPVQTSESEDPSREEQQAGVPAARLIEQQADTTTFTQDTKHTPPRTPVEYTIKSHERASSIHSTSSSTITRKPLPPTATIPTWSNSMTPPPTTSQTPSPSIDTTVYKPYRPPPITPPTIIPTTIIDDTELSLLQQNMLRQTYVPPIEMPASAKEVILEKRVEPVVELDTTARDEVTQVVTPTSAQAKEVVPDKPLEPFVQLPCDDTRARDEVSQVAKPLSAQAKRRAAHRRRMELDFGEKAR